MRTQSQYHQKSLVAIQKQCIGKSLSSYDANTWKILIFDKYTQSIVSSQFKMKDLRDHNITLYLNIAQDRQQLHGVTVIYLVQPTSVNVQLMANDIKNDKYSSVVVHFTGQPSPNLLSSFAKNISSKKSSLISRIKKIEYSCIGYHAIDNNMCILPTYNELLNLIVSLQVKPIFIYNPLNNASKQLVENIKNKLQTSYTHEQYIQYKNYGIVYVFNRDNDYFPVLSHGITYASLLENIYEINKIGNRIKNSKNSSKQNASNMSQLSIQDEIWFNKKNLLISQMQLQKQFNKYKAKMMSISPDQYSQFNQKSKKIQWHINNAQQMIRQAKSRRLNQFYDIELQIYSKKHLNKQNYKDLLQLLRQAPNGHDKVRIMIIYLQNIDSLDEIQQIESAFPDVKKNHKYNQLKQKKLRGSVQQRTSNKYIKKFAKGIWKNLISGQKKFMLTKQLEKIKNSDLSQLIQMGLAVQTTQALPANYNMSVKITRNIAYCMGGVCFHQYSNLAEFDSQVIYCGDELISFRDMQ